MVLPTSCGLSFLHPLLVLMVPVDVGARQHRRRAHALDLGARSFLAQRADVAPAEHEHRLAAQEVVPGLAEAPADLRRRPGLVQLLQELERLDVPRAVDQRLHVGRVEPVDVVVLVDLVARRDRERRRQRLEVIVALLADLEVQDDAAVRVGVVAVPVLAIEELRDLEQLLPGLGRHDHVVTGRLLELGAPLRIVEDVAAIVEDLAVGIVEDAVADALPGIEVAQRLRHGIVRPLRIFAALHVVVDRDHVVAGDQVAVEERADHDGVVETGALAQIQHHLGEQVGDRHERDVELAAGELLPDRPERVDRAGDAALGPGIEGQDRDIDAVERLLVRPEQRAELGLGRVDHGVVVVRTELEVDAAIVMPVDVLAGQGDRARSAPPAPRQAVPHAEVSWQCPLWLFPRGRPAGCRGRKFAVNGQN